jgi:branched-chain amino acid transport system permease protein
MTAAPAARGGGKGGGVWIRPALVIVLVAAALCAAAPFASDYVLHVLITSMYYTILAASWNLLAGFTGQFSLAHQAFAAIGAYTSGLLMVRYDFAIWAAIACGIVAAGVLGFALGRMVLHMRAIYLAIATWAFAETVRIMLTAGYAVTRGELGLAVPPLFADLSVRPYYYVFIALTLASLAAMYAIVCSQLGIFMRAIKDDELRAETLGVNTTRIKVLVFTVASAFAGLAGAFYAHYVVVLSPQIADFSEMAKLIIMVVVGGLGSFLGPLIAVTPIQSLHLYLANYGEWDMVIYAFAVIVLMRAQIGGVAALMRRFWRPGR